MIDGIVLIVMLYTLIGMLVAIYYKEHSVALEGPNKMRLITCAILWLPLSIPFLLRKFLWICKVVSIACFRFIVAFVREGVSLFKEAIVGRK